MTDTKTMTAPVSLAEIRKWVELEVGPCPHKDCKGCSRGRAVLALVELCEAYLALCDQNSQPWKFSADEHGAARDRLALAAKAVRP